LEQTRDMKTRRKVAASTQKERRCTRSTREDPLQRKTSVAAKDGRKIVWRKAAKPTLSAPADFIHHHPRSLSLNAPFPMAILNDPSPGTPAAAAAVIDTSASSLVSTNSEHTPKYPNKTCRGRKRMYLPPEAATMTAEEIKQWCKEQRRERNRAQARNTKQRVKDYLEHLEQQLEFYWRAYREVQRQLSEAMRA
jgi:hypothetical protein